MAIVIRPFGESDLGQLKAFNRRLQEAGAGYQFPESPRSSRLPMLPDRKVAQEYYLAVENATDVRGAFVLQHQEFSFGGKTVRIAHYDLPISEGYIDRRYGLLGVQLVTSALKRQPLLFSLGIGGYKEPLAQLLQKLGWRLCSVPFYFKVHHPALFLRNLALLRNSPAKRLLADLLASSGLGWLGIKTVHRLKSKTPHHASELRTEVVDQFGPWATEIWETCKMQYALSAVRDSQALNLLYSQEHRNFTRLKIWDGARVVGWAVLLNTQMTNSKHFGSLRVGSLVDCLGLKADALGIVRTATKHLEQSGVDLIVSNQGDAAWGAALKANGFLSGPSNYLLAASKGLVEVLQPFETNQATFHLNRGDGGGPIGL